jgi:hypothetical protein
VIDTTLYVFIKDVLCTIIINPEKKSIFYFIIVSITFLQVFYKFHPYCFLVTVIIFGRIKKI